MNDSNSSNNHEEMHGILAGSSVSDDDDDDESPKTVAEVLDDIVKAWKNEKSSPEILPHMSDHVDCLLNHISCMEKNIEPLPKDDLRVTIHKMEIDRIRYLISSYLRTRLEKIELYAVDIVNQEQETSNGRRKNEIYLSDAEFKYAKDWALNMETLIKSVILQHLPGTFQQYQVDKLALKPNLHTHVFIKANKDVEGVIIPGINKDEELIIRAGNQYILQYKSVAHLIKDGSVQLI